MAARGRYAFVALAAALLELVACRALVGFDDYGDGGTSDASAALPYGSGADSAVGNDDVGTSLDSQDGGSLDPNSIIMRGVTRSFRVAGKHTGTLDPSCPSASVVAWGAGGGSSNEYDGGAGGRAGGTWSLDGGDRAFTVWVGSAGQVDGGLGAPGGGGAGPDGGGGGGYSSVHIGSALLVVAGGGGGGGTGGAGGAGGGDTGLDGLTSIIGGKGGQDCIPSSEMDGGSTTLEGAGGGGGGRCGGGTGNGNGGGGGGSGWAHQWLTNPENIDGDSVNEMPRPDNVGAPDQPGAVDITCN